MKNRGSANLFFFNQIILSWIIIRTEIKEEKQFYIV